MALLRIPPCRPTVSAAPAVLPVRSSLGLYSSPPAPSGPLPMPSPVFDENAHPRQCAPRLNSTRPTKYPPTTSMGSLSARRPTTADAAAAAAASTPGVQLLPQDAARASPICYAARRKRAHPDCWQYAFAPVRSHGIAPQKGGAPPWPGSTTKSQ